MTSITTIAGVTPLMFETSLQAQILIPLVTSIAFGLIAVTLLILLVVPAFYAILHDFGLTEISQTTGRAHASTRSMTEPTSMKYGQLPGLDKQVSRLVLGCDNKLTADDGAGLWSHFVEIGGTAFDTAFVYGGGACEKALGEWIERQGVAGAITVIVKGAHTPHCDPASLQEQLAISLDRLRLEKADIYIMHRDNPEIAVGEFVDLLDSLVGQGRIGCFGGSNWSVERFPPGQRLCRPHRQAGHGGAQQQPVAGGHGESRSGPAASASSDAATRRYLAETGTAHFAWSSQARGYFHETASELPEGTRADDCFDSAGNRQRRQRAIELAARLGKKASHVATAYVLGQPFPSFALIGPRAIAELDDTLACLDIELGRGSAGLAGAGLKRRKSRFGLRAQSGMIASPIGPSHGYALQVASGSINSTLRWAFDEIQALKFYKGDYRAAARPLANCRQGSGAMLEHHFNSSASPDAGYAVVITGAQCLADEPQLGTLVRATAIQLRIRYPDRWRSGHQGSAAMTGVAISNLRFTHMPAGWLLEPKVVVSNRGTGRTSSAA